VLLHPCVNADAFPGIEGFCTQYTIIVKMNSARDYFDSLPKSRLFYL